MNLRRISGFLASGVAAGALGLFIASAAFAAAPTAGLVSLSVQGVGTGALAAGDCASPAIACSTPTTCSCLTGANSLVGNQGFKGGSLTYTISVESSVTALPVSTSPGSCVPATGLATLANKKGTTTITMDLTGLACSTQTPAVDVFNGTYTITGGTGKFATATGSGALNGDQQTGTGTISHVALTGSLQP